MNKTKTKETAAPTLFPQEQPKAQPITVAEPKRPKKSDAAKASVPAVIKHPAPTNLLAAIAQAAADPKCDPGKMHALLDARDRLMAQEARVAFTAAFIDMQDDLPIISALGRIEIEGKPGKRGQKTPYATFSEISRVVKPILRQHRFALLLLPDIGPNGQGVLMRGSLSYVCDTPYGRMVHTESCAIAAPLETGGSKNNVQGVGSSLSYTKRYCTVALLNLVSQAPEDTDDDGNLGKRPAAQATISKLQLAELTDAVKDCGVPADVFESKYGKLDYLPASQFDEAIAACKRFKANKKENIKPEKSHG